MFVVDMYVMGWLAESEVAFYSVEAVCVYVCACLGMGVRC